MRNFDAITGDLLIVAAIALAYFIGRSLRRNPTDSGEVGTGAGRGGDPATTEATSWVNGSADCPEAPAQAHRPGPLTREPDLFDEQAALYGPARMYGRLEPIDEGDPFAGWSHEEFDALTDDEWAWRLFEEIEALPTKEAS